jgi:hypothetical protein
VPVVGMKMGVGSVWSLCSQSLFCFMRHQEEVFVANFVWIYPFLRRWIFFSLSFGWVSPILLDIVDHRILHSMQLDDHTEMCSL